MCIRIVNNYAILVESSSTLFSYVQNITIGYLNTTKYFFHLIVPSGGDLAADATRRITWAALWGQQ